MADGDPRAMRDSSSTGGLRRVISLPLLAFYGLGNILGAGIYVLIGEVAGVSGGYAPIAFLLASLLVVPSALTYAELSARYPVSAGEAVYLFEAFGARWLSIAVGLLLALAGAVSTAALARGFAGYMSVVAEVPSLSVIIPLVLAMGAICAWGIGLSVKVAAVLTIVEIAGLLLMLWAGAPYLARVEVAAVQWLPGADIALWQGIGMGAVLAFYAFLGFEDMVNVAEEVRDPERNMPRAILAALLVATLLYVGVAVVAVLVMPPAELAASGAPLADAYRAASGRWPGILVAIGLLAAINGALVQIVMSTRVVYGMSRRGWLAGRLGFVSPRTGTPLVATALVTALVLALAMVFPLKSLAWATSLIILMVFALVNAALWRIRGRAPTPARRHAVPRWVSLFGALSSALFALAGLLLGLRS